MPSNICTHSFAHRVRELVFAHRVRELVFAHPDGIADADVAHLLHVPRGRVRTTVRDDGNMIVTEPFFVTQVTATGDEVYFPRTERAEYTYRPRPFSRVAPTAEPAATIRPHDPEPPARVEQTRRETFAEMMDRMTTELAQRYLEDAPSVGVNFAMMFTNKVRAQQAAVQS